jgi:L-fucose mutarotase
MLKGIPKVISPELIKILMEMGHGDEIVIADGNFPAASVAKRLICCDGLNVPELLDGILKLFPLDTKYSTHCVFLMQLVPGDTVATPIWEEYRGIILKHTSEFKDFANIERFAFYEAAKKAYAVIATSEKALYANIILRKGVVVE